jgi:hypothetical protein
MRISLKLFYVPPLQLRLERGRLCSVWEKKTNSAEEKNGKLSLAESLSLCRILDRWDRERKFGLVQLHTYFPLPEISALRMHYIYIPDCDFPNHITKHNGL